MPIRLIGDPSEFQGKLRGLAKQLNDSATLSVGFLENATYPDGKPVAQVAFWQEFGAPNAGIPPRPFFRTAIANNKEYWAEALASLLKHNEFNVRKSLAGLGQVIQQDIKDSITEIVAPPLSQVTLMLRLMKKLNTDSPFMADKSLRKGRVKGDAFKVTGATVGVAAHLVKEGFAASGVSTKPLIDTGVMQQAVDYRIDDR